MDTLRPPAPLDPEAERYRDWLHFNVFDGASGLIGLVNLSLHGSPRDPRARAIGTALVHHPQHGWLGNMDVRDFSSAHLSETGITLPSAALFVDTSHRRVHVSARLPDEGLIVDCVAAENCRMLRIDQRLPFGSGWISWAVIPQMTLTGRAIVRGKSIELSLARGYHDHNWGRWYWGDDAGWDWGTFSDQETATTIVFSRATDRDRTYVSPLFVTVDTPDKRRSFVGTNLSYRWEGRYLGTLRRLPGSLAALHCDRMSPTLPARAVLEAQDGQARVRVEFLVRAAAQLIAAEPTRPGTSFVHELVGEFAGELEEKGKRRLLSGLGVVEYVD